MKKPRSATILTKENCQFAVIDAEDYKDILMSVEMKKIDDKVAFITENLLQGLSKEITSKYSYFFSKKKYYKGNIIYKEGDVANSVYII